MVIHVDGQVLLVKGWLSAGRWLLPGGGLHRSEEPTVGAAREVSEETGLAIAPDTLKELGQGTAKETGLKFQSIVYEVELKEPQQPQLHGLELVDAKWFPLDEVLASPGVTSYTKRLLRSWRRTP